MTERTMRRSQYRPGAEHHMSEFDDRPAQVYAQAMAAARAQSLGIFASLALRPRAHGRRKP